MRLDSVSRAISRVQHEGLDTLAHELAETHDVIYTIDSNGLITSAQANTLAGDAVRNVDELAQDSAGLIVGARERQYEADGVTLQATMTMTAPNHTDGVIDAARWTKS